MTDGLTYEQLLQGYRDLQLRVTRFSATEQALINTRDKLDQELELYKRLQHYSGLSLQIKNESELLQLVSEAIVDILDVESSIVYIKCLEQPSRSMLVYEGFRFYESKDMLELELSHLFDRLDESQPILRRQDLSASRLLSIFSSGIINRFAENDLAYEIIFFGAITFTNEQSYKPIEERQLHIFNLLTQQMHAVFAKIMSSRKIEQQMATISQTANELRKLSLIATKSKSGVIITDTYGRIEWVNDAFTKISGFHLDEIKGRKPKDFLQGQATNDNKRQLLSEALSKKEDIETVIVNYTKEGRPYYNQLEIISVFDDAGKHINFIALQKDITTEINFNQEILKINSRFKLVSETTKMGIWEWDLATDYFNADSILANIVGLDSVSGPYEKVFNEWMNKMHPDDIQHFRDKHNRIKSGESKHITQEYRFFRYDDGKMIFLKSSIVGEYNKKGELVRLIGGTQDVTAEKNMQHNLRMALNERDLSLEHINVLKNFYEKILRHSPSEILVFDKDLKLNFSNIEPENFNSIWNLDMDISLPDFLHIQPDDSMQPVLNSIQMAVKENRMIQLEDSFIRENLEEVFYLRSIMPSFDSSGLLENIIVIGVDITNQKNSEKALLNKNDELRKINMELDHFVYSISHDLRSPLLSIKGLTSLVLQTEGLSEENKRFLNMTMNSASRLDHTIQEILEYSRNSRLDLALSTFDIANQIRSIFDDLKYVSDNTFELEITSDQKTMITSDKPRLGVLLKNIIGNSIKYRKPDNQLLIKVNIRNTHENMIISIEDNGEGIALKHLNKVFNMFYRGTTTSVGTGLGLYICKEIVNKLGGNISVQSEQGVGTVIKLELPHININI